jgi:K+-sensing histidine kinase KdpD
MPVVVRRGFLAKLLVTVAVIVVIGSTIGAFFSVGISVTTDEDRVAFAFADDGSEIPEGELPSLAEGYETAIEHGSGVGLWLVNWLVDEMGGDIQFEDRAPTGTVVTLRFERTDAEASSPLPEVDVE